jgi:hypothetical protein
MLRWWQTSMDTEQLPIRVYSVLQARPEAIHQARFKLAAILRRAFQKHFHSCKSAQRSTCCAGRSRCRWPPPRPAG